MNLLSLIASNVLADEFARLRSEIAAMEPMPRHIVVLGCAGGEGATTVAAHLALAMCGHNGAGRVFLAEANVRSPSFASGLGLAPGPGLLDWDLHSPLPMQALEGVPGLKIMTAGGRPALSSGPTIEERLEAACARARADFGFVVWDAPAATRYADGLKLAAQCDGVLVVVEMDQSRVDGLRYVRTALERNRARILGSVLNRTGRYWPRAAKSLSG